MATDASGWPLPPIRTQATTSTAPRSSAPRSAHHLTDGSTVSPLPPTPLPPYSATPTVPIPNRTGFMVRHVSDVESGQRRNAYPPPSPVILMSLLCIVVELLDVALDQLDLGEDVVGGGGPDERFGGSVPVVDVVVDVGDQGANGTESAAADRLAGDDAAPGFDLVDPRRSDRGEVELHLRVLFQPGTTS